MEQINLSGDYDLKQAFFWGRFHIESPTPMSDSAGPALFQARSGAFFVVAMPRPGPSQSPYLGDRIESKEKLQAWLGERCDFIVSQWRD